LEEKAVSIFTDQVASIRHSSIAQKIILCTLLHILPSFKSVDIMRCKLNVFINS